ncbi:isopentenyl-diphosphate Delta-isomerase 1-like [Styela clava]
MDIFARRVASKLLLTKLKLLNVMQARSANSLAETLASKDKNQVNLLYGEHLIIVDENDKPIGSASKLDCHLNSEGPPLHRAFSVFFFNEKNELLMQRRSNAKVTFPGYYTNTCCSHPQNNKLEMEEADAMGVKRAAQRKMTQELGISAEQFPLKNINYVTRILYKAPCSDTFGEHEIDYVLFAKGNVDVNINENEVSEVTYVPYGGMDAFVKNCESRGISITPWFKLIMESQLNTWWRDIDNIHEHFNHKAITKF